MGYDTGLSCTRPRPRSNHRLSEMIEQQWATGPPGLLLDHCEQLAGGKIEGSTPDSRRSDKLPLKRYSQKACLDLVHI